MCMDAFFPAVFWGMQAGGMGAALGCQRTGGINRSTTAGGRCGIRQVGADGSDGKAAKMAAEKNRRKTEHDREAWNVI